MENEIYEIIEEVINQLGENRIKNDEYPLLLVQDTFCDIASEWGVDLDEDLDEDFDLEDFIIEELTEKELM